MIRVGQKFYYEPLNEFLYKVIFIHEDGEVDLEVVEAKTRFGQKCIGLVHRKCLYITDIEAVLREDYNKSNRKPILTKRYL